MSVKAARTHQGVAASRARPMDSMPMRWSARAVSPAPASTPAPTRALRATRAARRGPLWGSLGSSEGSRTGGVRSPGSAGVTPVRRASRAARPSGRGSASASS